MRQTIIILLVIDSLHRLRPPHLALHQTQIHASQHILLGQPAEYEI